MLSRRGFLQTLGFAPAIAAAERGRVKITDVQSMVLQGPRTYTLVRVMSDAGVYGIGEAYGSPGVGVKEAVAELRSYFIGKDPLEIGAAYTGLGARTDGSARYAAARSERNRNRVVGSGGEDSQCPQVFNITASAANSATVFACIMTRDRAIRSIRRTV